MKNIFQLKKLVFLFTINLLILAQPGKCMIVLFNYANFICNDTSAYTELYFKIPITSLKIVNTDKNKFHASVKIEYSFRQKSKTIFSGSYFLESPTLNDTNNLNFALLDLRRICLKQGSYNFEVIIKDENNLHDTADIRMTINNQFDKSGILISDIQLADTIYSTETPDIFTRNNYKIIPNVFNTYSIGQKHLYFYSEIYNSDKNLKENYFYIHYYIARDSQRINDREGLSKLVKHSIVPFNGVLDISGTLPGEYQLVIEVISSQNRLMASKTIEITIQREDQLLLSTIGMDQISLLREMFGSFSWTQLKLAINYIYFISDKDQLKESNKLISSKDSLKLKEFFIRFWMKRDPEKPVQAWINFLKKVEDCNKMFSTSLRKGYLTDRGRVYLQYGPPNQVIESPQSAISYPYEIWHYYDLTLTQHNKRFVFFNMTGALNEFSLLHSDAVGEPQNPNWQQIIKKFNRNPDKKIYGDTLDDDFKE